MPSDPTSYPGYRFPIEVIQHAVWLDHLDTSKNLAAGALN
jgi:hypothetical protein